MRALLGIVGLAALLAFGCGPQETAAPQEPAPTPSAKPASKLPPLAPTNIASLAQASADHTTLVTALEAADYVTAVAASGPLTVFAPTNAAFAKLPEGTVESLLETRNADHLREILKYHVTTSALDARSLRDGQTLGMANGAKATIHLKDGQISINDANVIASTRGENGMLYIIDTVLLPPAKN